jgi:hypothetical protein
MNKQINEGYAIELVRDDLIEDLKYYLLDVEVAGPDIKFHFPETDPRTLVYEATQTHSTEEVVNCDILFFDNKQDAEDLIAMVEKYQDYDEKLCGPFKEGLKFTFKIANVKSYQEYSDLTKDFLDKNNHMDFNLEQDKAKKWLDESKNLSMSIKALD